MRRSADTTAARCQLLMLCGPNSTRQSDAFAVPCACPAHVLALADGDAVDAGHGLHAQLLHGLAALLLRAALLALAAALLCGRGGRVGPEGTAAVRPCPISRPAARAPQAGTGCAALRRCAAGAAAAAAAQRAERALPMLSESRHGTQASRKHASCQEPPSQGLPRPHAGAARSPLATLPPAKPVRSRARASHRRARASRPHRSRWRASPPRPRPPAGRRPARWVEASSPGQPRPA